jgi:peptide/nickel transport system substrate-binding protein
MDGRRMVQLPRARSRRHRGVRIAAAALVMALAAAACGDDGGAAPSVSSAATTTTEAKPVKGGTITFGSWTEVAGLDPILYSGSGNTGGGEFGLLYDRLVQWNPTTKKYDMGTAESVTPNADFTQWTVKVRPNITFTDGTAYDAAAVKFNFDRQRKDNGALRGALATITDVSVVDPLTVKVTLNESWASFNYLMSLSFGMIASPAAVAKGGTSFSTKPEGAGAGPFQFVSYAKGEGVVLKRNDKYWGGDVYLDSVKIVTLNGGQATLDALKTGTLDVGFLRDPGPIQQSRTDKLAGADLAFSDGEMLLVNGGVEVTCAAGKPEPLCTGKPDGTKVATKSPGSDPNVRKAVALAIDVKALDQRANGGKGLPATSLFAPSFPWDPKVSLPAPNVEEAKKLVTAAKAAGWDGKIRLACTNTPARLATSQYIKASLEAVGMTVDDTKTGVDVNAILGEVITKKDYDLACWGLQFSPDDGTVQQIESFLRSTSASNRTGFKSTPIDGIISELKKATTDEAKTAAYKKIADIWSTDAPSVPLAHVEERIVWTAKVHGVSTTAQSQVLLAKAWIG